MGKIVESLAFARAYSDVEDALVVDDASQVSWDEEADFVVVGFGGAGVAATNQALDGGLSVIALDRFAGGGATTLNGGIIYYGGGTSVQKAAGCEDSPEGMYEYLKRELGGVVTDETLRRYCEAGPETIEWLKAHGVRFGDKAYPKKSSYPSREYFLYHPDNSLLKKFRGNHPPAPRGHKVQYGNNDMEEGFGRGLYEPQRDAAASAGLRLFGQTEARQLVVDRSGTVIGLKANRVFPDDKRWPALVKAHRLMNKWSLLLPATMPGGNLTAKVARFYKRRAERIVQAAARPVFIRARRGICISSGGFIFNKAMVADFAPRYVDVYTLGTPADDGSGILLGRSAAGAMGLMDRVSSWRFLNPPAAWGKGMLVNRRGARFVDEASYGAHIGGALMKPGNDGYGWSILDAQLWKEAKASIKQENLYSFQRDPARLLMTFGTKKAPTLEALAEKTGFDKGVFLATVEEYNRAKAGEVVDPFNKAPEDMGALETGPFYAMDMSASSRFMPLPSITVGGLVVDEETGLVMRDDGSTIPGLYAAGRSAIGLCSAVYLSGLSAGDCIFSGRRAGRHASGLSGGPEPSRKGISAAVAHAAEAPAALAG